MRRHLWIDQYDWAQKRLGVDVVRFGDDRTVIFPRQGLASFRPVVMRNARTTDIAARVMVGMKRWGAELAIIDDTGHWGHGVIDNLAVAGRAVCRHQLRRQGPEPALQGPARGDVDQGRRKRSGTAPRCRRCRSWSAS